MQSTCIELESADTSKFLNAVFGISLAPLKAQSLLTGSGEHRSWALNSLGSYQFEFWWPLMYNLPLHTYRDTWIWRLFTCSPKEVIVIIIKQNNFPRLFRRFLCAPCCRFLVFFYNYRGTKDITPSCRSDRRKNTHNYYQSYWKATPS